MEKELYFKRKKYISAKRAAMLVGYTTDYVGQLCRAGKLESTAVGRNWYVLESSILKHKEKNHFLSTTSKKTKLIKVNPTAPKSISVSAPFVIPTQPVISAPAPTFTPRTVSEIKYFQEKFSTSPTLSKKVELPKVEPVKVFASPIVPLKKIIPTVPKKPIKSPFTLQKNFFASALAVILVLTLASAASGSIKSKTGALALSWSAISDWSGSVVGKVLAPWFPKSSQAPAVVEAPAQHPVQTTIVINPPGLSVTGTPSAPAQARTSLSLGDVRNYIDTTLDSRIGNFRQEFLSLLPPPGVSREYLSRQLDAIVSLIGRSSGSSSSSGGSSSSIDLSNLSASSPISYDSGTGAFSFDFSTDNTWTGTNEFDDLTITGEVGCLSADGSGVVTGSGSACGAGGSNSFLFPFTARSYGVSTSTTIGLLNGFFSTASSTISSSLYLPSLSQGFSYIGSNGLINTTASSSIRTSWLTNDSGFTSYIWPFTPISAGVVATTSQINLAGFLSTASSTIVGNATTTGSVGAGALYINGDYITDFTGTGLSVTNGILNTTGGSGSFAWPFTPETWGVSTTTTIGLLNGFLSTASSTIVGNATTTGTQYVGSQLSVNGNLGVGTSNPSTSLHIFKAGVSTAVATIETGGAGDAQLFFKTENGANSNAATIGLNDEDAGKLLFKIGTTNMDGGAHLAITSSRFVGINTNSPTAMLEINRFGGADYLFIDSGSGTAGDIFKINDLGNVGIGTTNPTAKLQINGGFLSTASSTIVGNATTTGSHYVGAINVGGDYISDITGTGLSVSGGVLSVSGVSSSTLLSDSNTFSGTTNNFTGLFGISSSTPWGKLSVNPDALGSGVPEFVIGSSSATHFIVNGKGNVGIGVTDPTFKLTLSNANNLSGNTTYSTFLIDGSNNTLTMNSASAASNNLVFSKAGSTVLTINGTTNTTETPRITTASTKSFAIIPGTTAGLGVGIGTTSPFTTLDVAGTGPSITLSDNAATTNQKHWLFTSQLGTFSIGTSTDLYATTSISALEIAGDGFGTTTLRGLSISGAQATSTSNVGFNITNGCYAISGSCISGGSGSGLSSLTGNSLTKGYFLVGDDAGLSQATSSLFVSSVGNIGIASTSPSSQLSISMSSSTPALYIGAAGSSTPAFYVSSANGNGNVGISTTSPWAQLSVESQAGAAAFSVGSSTFTSFVVDAGGRVGIGRSIMSTSLPRGSLQIGVGTDSNLFSTNPQLYITGAGTSQATFRDSSNDVEMSTGVNSTSGFLSVGTNHLLSFSTNNSSRMTITAGGNVSVGSSTASYLLTSTSATAPQLALSASTGISQWTFRNAGGSLFLSTTTVAGSATTSISALEIAGDGFGTTTLRGLSISGAQATSTSNVGFNITGGCYAISGTCLSTSGGGSSASSTLLGDSNTFSGTKNNFTGLFGVSSSTPWARFSVDTTSLAADVPEFSVGSSTRQDFIITQAGNVGIGNSSPASKLHIGAGSDTPGIAADLYVSNNGPTAFTLRDSTNNIEYFVQTSASGGNNLVRLGTSTTHPLYFRTNGIDRMVLSASGNFGIGTTTPSYLLQVATSSSNGGFKPQFTLTDMDGGTNGKHWNLSSLGGNFYLGTSTDLYASTSISALEISGSGFGTTTLRGLNISGAQATSTSNVGFNLSGGCYAIGGTCLSTSGSFSNTLANGGTATTTFYNGGIIFASSTGSGLLSQSAAAKNFFWDETNKKLGLGTSTPFAKLSVNLEAGENAFVVGSSTATSLIVDKNGNVGVGTAVPQNKLDISGNSDTGGSSATKFGITDTRSGGSTFVISGSSDGATIYPFLGTTSNHPFYFVTNNTYAWGISSSGGTSFGNTYFDKSPGTNNVIIEGKLGIATTTVTYALNPYSASDSQLALSAGAGVAQWAFRNAGGDLFLSTTTVAGTATTSTAALTISGSGFGTTTVRGLNIDAQATSTSDVGFNITTGCYAVNGSCVGGGSGGGSGTVSSGVFGQLAFYGANGTTISGTSTIVVSTTTATARVGIGTSTGLTATLAIQGAAGLDILKVSSSTGPTVFTVSEWGALVQNISSTTAINVLDGSGNSSFVVDTTQASTNTGIDITASGGQTGNLFNMFSSAGSFLSGFTAAGGLFMNISSTTAINLYDGSGNPVFTVNSTSRYVGIGTGTPTELFSVATSSTAMQPVFNIYTDSSTGATSTIGFFVSTTTGRTAGTGLGLPAALKNYLIVGNGKVQAGMAVVNGGICVDNDGWCTASTTGRISSVTSTTGGSDVAEMYNSYESLEPGDVVAMSSPRNFVKVANRNSGDIGFGIVSTEPGVILGLPPDEKSDKGIVKDVVTDGDISSTTPVSIEKTVNKFPIALAGRVPIKVSIENGQINPGDYLTLSSSTPGVAVKATQSGNVLGQAIEGYSDSGAGKILIFVQSNYYVPSSILSSGSQSATSTSTATSTAADLDSFFSIGGFKDSLLAFFDNLGLKFMNGIAYIKNVFAERLTVGTPERPTGITIYDEATGDPYCLKMLSGVISSAPGECSVVSLVLPQEEGDEVGTSTPDIIPTDTGTSTPPVVIEPQASSTPPVAPVVEEPQASSTDPVAVNTP